MESGRIASPGKTVFRWVALNTEALVAFWEGPIGTIETGRGAASCHGTAAARTRFTLDAPVIRLLVPSGERQVKEAFDLAQPFPPVPVGALMRRGWSGASGIALTSISGIGRSIACKTALASSL